ncbi:MAG TPA: ATP-binding protein, partial [Burkholderiaceae bacterium]|nr:ATP-binding protein [Burkholderiaceae bacterium]
PIQYAWHEIVEERSTERLREDAQRLENVLRRHGPDALKAVIDTMVEAQPVDDEKFILLADPSFARVVGNLPVWPRDIPAAPGTYTRSFDLNGRSVQAIFIRTTLPGGYNLVVGRNTAKFHTVETLFWVGLVGAAMSVLVFGVFGGLLIRGALLSEIHEISQTAAAIVAGDLSRRLPRRGGANELDILAHTVNRMLEQIELLIQGIRNVSNSIAHDLRTPLTELRARLEELTVTRPPLEETFTEIDIAVADVDRVIAIFNALLRLAEIDNGARRSGFIPVDIAKVASDAVEFYQPLAELRGISLCFDSTSQHPGECIAAGDPLLLAQAIGNLIDNALKYAPHEIKVFVQAAQQSKPAVTITVADDGPGIPDEEKVKVVERFYRSDASRGTPGVGLGLSLVAAVTKLHGGSLILSDAGPGLNATMVISQQPI